MHFSSHGNKASVVRDDLADRFAGFSLCLIAIQEYVTPDNVSRLPVLAAEFETDAIAHANISE